MGPISKHTSDKVDDLIHLKMSSLGMIKLQHVFGIGAPTTSTLIVNEKSKKRSERQCKDRWPKMNQKVARFNGYYKRVQ